VGQDRSTTEVLALALEQASLDTSIKLPDIPRGTQAQNIAYFNQAVFGRENEHFFCGTRYEEGEGEEV